MEVDLPRIYEIEINAFPHPYDKDFFYHLWKRDIAHFYVTEGEGKIVGYIIGIRRSRKLGHVISIAVETDQRKKGVGTLLMYRLMDDIKSKEIRLEVGVTNTVAQTFYRSLGFEAMESLPQYYQDGEDAIRMTLNVTSKKEDLNQTK